MSKFLIAGLGNVGREYEHTRHNIGFDVADAFVEKHGGLFVSGRLAAVAQVKFRGKLVVCIKPTTYMNESGKALKYWVGKESIDLTNLLVISDETALPLNKVRLRPGGSDAGHNGLKSIHEHLGTSQFPRLRFGTGNHYPRGMQADFVLAQWYTEEKPLVNLKISKCVDIIESFLTAGIERTMSEVNKLEIGL